MDHTPSQSNQRSPTPSDALRYQAEILPKVSRTFALTIPQLPQPLNTVVGNAYLLCRIADTIEDEAGLDPARKQQLHQRFVDLLNGVGEETALARDLLAELTRSATADEQDLLRHIGQVVAVTRSFDPRQKTALEKCVRIMCRGMPEFQRKGTRDGLQNMAEMDRYCYFVAGVVGEMLTELFCCQADDIDANHDRLMRLAPSFGQGLQMTNILKDIWQDEARGMCWLPADVFARAGYDTRDIKRHIRNKPFVDGLQQLISVANRHLQNALDYTLLIPARHVGIRRFCLWALGMAVLTLRKIDRNPTFASGDQVKISRRAVKWAVGVSNLLTRQDGLLRGIHKLCSNRLEISSFNVGAWLPDYRDISLWSVADTGQSQNIPLVKEA